MQNLEPIQKKLDNLKSPDQILMELQENAQEIKATELKLTALRERRLILITSCITDDEISQSKIRLVTDLSISTITKLYAEGNLLLTKWYGPKED